MKKEIFTTKGVLIYRESLQMLSILPDDKAGKVIKSIANFHYDGILDYPDDKDIRRTIDIIKDAMIRDNKIYIETCEKRRKSGSKGGKAKAKQMPNKC